MSIPVPSEAATQRACLDYLALRGIAAWRFNSGARPVGEGASRRFLRCNTAPGCADILGILPGGEGRFFALEVKSAGGRLRPNQAAFLDVVRANGGLSLVVRSLDELIAALAAEGY